jgi:Mg/Co/Ni transporter MgtE
LSSFILARNERLLQRHAVIVQFLTMLVGAGGNAGNQASVGVIRGIAVGTIDRSNVGRVLQREFLMGLTLSVILGVAGFIRAAVFAIPMLETFAITSSLFMIVIISVVVGSALPLGMQMIGVDPAHSSTTIQVIMDVSSPFIGRSCLICCRNTRIYGRLCWCCTIMSSPANTSCTYVFTDYYR